MGKKFIIAIGSKARQGKDTVANFIKELRPNDEVHVLHWADALYEEAKNAERKMPLIKKLNIDGKMFYMLLDNSNLYSYRVFEPQEITNIHDLMLSRGLEEYWGMNEKDAPILQAWGTNFRRQKINEAYWINKTHGKASKIVDDFNAKVGFNAEPPSHNLYICIPDTRFENEYNEIRHQCFAPYEPWHGIYVKVVRQNEDGSQYIDPTRNHNHPSEIELDGVPGDFTLEAKSGDLETLKRKTEIMLDILDQKW